MPSIAETTFELIQWVFPEHAGAPGQIHGGRMMEWSTQAGTMAVAAPIRQRKRVLAGTSSWESSRRNGVIATATRFEKSSGRGARRNSANRESGDEKARTWHAERGPLRPTAGGLAGCDD